MINCEEKLYNNIIDNNDLFLILDKDGVLRGFEKTGINEKWRILFNNSLYQKNINSHKLTDDIGIYPLDDKLFVSTENDFIPFEIFVKNLTNNKPIMKNNISIEGHIKNFFYIIDLKTGKNLETIINYNRNHNFENYLKKDEIILKKVDYLLIKKEINKNEILMNISYSDINIEHKNNKNDENNNMKDMYHIINYFKLNLEIGKIKSIHSYNYNKRKLTLIYDKNILEKKKFNTDTTNNFDNNKKSINKEINYLKEIYDDLIVNIKKYFKYYFFILLILSIIILIKSKIFQKNLNKANIIKENPISKNNTNSIDNETSNNKENIKEIEKNEVEEENEDNYANKNTKEKTINMNKSEGKCGAGIWDDDEDENDTKRNEKEKVNNSKKSEEKYSAGIWDDDEDENDTKRIEKVKVNNSKKSEEKCGSGIWDDDEDEKEDDTKNSAKEKSNKKRCGAGMWDDEDEEEENDISKNINNENNSKKLESNSISINTINETISESEKLIETNKMKKADGYKINKNLIKNFNINNNKNIKNVNKISNNSRLDDDFKNLEKIGKGGFGIVLKGEQRYDNGIRAIKIIKLKDISDKDSIIDEVKTMMQLSNQHVVQYIYCWKDNNLGTATKFFDDDDEDDEIGDLSIGVSKTSIVKKNLKLKTIKNNKIIDDEIKEENQENSNFNDSSKKTINLHKNDSQKLKKNKNKYYCNYRDDSHIINKSKISKKYIKENNVKSENINEDEYFVILMEYCDGLTLDNYIKQHSGKGIDRKIIYNFTSQILKGLVKIHSSGIVHRDIKPCNIFIKDGQIKIGDFGLAIRYSNTGKLLKSKKIEGTLLYLSPEQKTFQTYSEKVDIYACGITLYEMCSCFSTEFERWNDIISLKNENKINEKVCKNFPEETELIKLMMKKDFNERPSAEQILRSELFINLGKSLG